MRKMIIGLLALTMVGGFAAGLSYIGRDLLNGPDASRAHVSAGQGVGQAATLVSRGQARKGQATQGDGGAREFTGSGAGQGQLRKGQATPET